MGLLLVLCLCISTWTGKTLGDENGLISVTVSQRSDAILPCSPTTKEDLSFKSFKWRRDGQNVFYYDAGNHYNNGLDGQDPQFKDRVSFFEDQLHSGNASIQIQNVKFPDGGIYSCEISGLNSGSQTFNIKLVVDVPGVNAEVGSDVILPCSPSGKDDLTHQLFDWQKDDTQEVFLYDNGKYYNNGKTGQNEIFKNRVEFFQDQLQFGNASIRIKNAKRTDSGNYSCAFPKLQREPKFYIKLVVHQKPTFSSDEVGNYIRVNCSVYDVSKVKMELHNFDDGSLAQPYNNVTSQNRQIFMFSVTKKGNYGCLLKYTESCYQIYSQSNLLKPAKVGIGNGIGNGTGIGNGNGNGIGIGNGNGNGIGIVIHVVVVVVIVIVIVIIAGLFFLWRRKRSPGLNNVKMSSCEGNAGNSTGDGTKDNTGSEVQPLKEVSKLTNDA